MPLEPPPKENPIEETLEGENKPRTLFL